MYRTLHRSGAIALTTVLLSLSASAWAADEAKTLTGADAFVTWKEAAPGVRYHITPGDLPAPFATKSASNAPGLVDMPKDAKPTVADGFSVTMLADGFEQPRVVRVAPNGDLFVADSSANTVNVLRLGSDGKVSEKSVFATDLNQPYGIAFYPSGDSPEWVYVANADSIVRFPYKSGDTKASGAAEPVVGDIPSNHHWTRDIVFSPDGKTLYLSVGSGSNISEDAGDPEGGIEAFVKSHPLGEDWGAEEGRAAVIAFDPDGKNRRVVATGIRNCSGMTVQPATGALWCVTNERDGLGDNLVPDYATTVKEGAFYGWPWYYIGDNEDPRAPLKGQRPDLKGKVTVPDVLFQAHSAPLGITFYDGDMFPAEYKGDAFVALHGSWNRGNRTGYKVVRVLLKDGKPTGEYEDFMTGFVESADNVWGRPVGVAVAKDGSLIVTEDGAGTIWRVSHDANPS
jgi:glucose/arabinose dehydrogenase